MAEIFFPVQVIFSFGVSYIPHAYFCGDGLQFAVVIDFAGETVQGVVGEHQFDNIFSKPCYFIGVGEDIAVGNDGGVAGCLNPRITSGLEGNLHATNPAGAMGLEVGGVAKGGNAIFPEYPVDEGQDGFPFDYFVGHMVKVGYFADGCTHDDGVRKGAASSGEMGG
jgi:hypothetical protein